MTDHSLNRFLSTDSGDIDPVETAEWRDALLALVAAQGPARARFILDRLANLARSPHIAWSPELVTPYVNSIAVDQQPAFPGDLAIEEKLASLMRWNALAMVARANMAYGELGGHIASYASAADLFEVGFNHFFQARNEPGRAAPTGEGPPRGGSDPHEVGERGGQHAAQGGDLVFFQPHSAPGVYARAFLEGRLGEADLAHYRQEITASRHGARGLSSYPHPFLMPDFWQFPTGSMGIGPISSIYHARFMRYLTHRGLVNCEGRKVWGVFGDGEMDEPESMSALTLASREKLDNLVWVVNCNLQRLDGPVRGNGRIIDELEKLFRGAGWNVIKLVWGSDWDGLFARDTTGALVRAFADTVDGQMQTFAAKDGRFNRDNFFGQNPELARLAQGMTDEQIDRLKRGGHDLVKIHAAYAAAAKHGDGPTVILAHTKKGYGMGTAAQGKMTTHSQKKLDEGALIEFRNRFNLPLSDEQARNLEFFKPAQDSAEMRYLHAQRAKLGGYLPQRLATSQALPIPALASYAAFATAAGGKEMSTTMAFVRLLANLLKDKELGPRIVPIVADEARTFGMANLFKQVGIYSSVGPALRAGRHRLGAVVPGSAGRPDPGGGHQRSRRDRQLDRGRDQLQRARLSDGAVLHLLLDVRLPAGGRRDLGCGRPALARLPARRHLRTHHSGRRRPAAPGRQQSPGGGDRSQLPRLRSGLCRRAGGDRRPGHAGDAGRAAGRFLLRHADERELRPARPAARRRAGCRARLLPVPPFCGQPAAGKKAEAAAQVTLMGSGAILTEVIRAAQQLADQGIACDVLSVTSWSELARDGQALERRAIAGEAAGVPFVAQQLAGTHGPIIAATDYVRAVPESIRAFVPAGRRYLTLGTDGFGRSDTRAALREFFGVDAAAIASAAAYALSTAGDDKSPTGTNMRK